MHGRIYVFFSCLQPVWSGCSSFVFVYLPRDQILTSKSCDRLTSTQKSSITSITPALQSTFQANLRDIPELKWQYYGSEEGYSTFYPAQNLSTCGNYDPRYRFVVCRSFRTQCAFPLFFLLLSLSFCPPPTPPLSLSLSQTLVCGSSGSRSQGRCHSDRPEWFDVDDCVRGSKPLRHRQGGSQHRVGYSIPNRPGQNALYITVLYITVLFSAALFFFCLAFFIVLSI